MLVCFEFEGKNYRLPLYVIYDYDNHFRDAPNTSNIDRGLIDLIGKNKEFCSFVVKNGGCQKRNDWFHKLNEYKPVASGGPLFNNIGYILPRGEESVSAKLKFLNSYKFNLCFENSSYPGYATEKLYEALCAKTVPIYWGSDYVSEIFNTDSMVLLKEYNTYNLDKMLQEVIYLDNNDDAWLNKVNQQVFKEKELLEYFKINSLRKRFLNKIDEVL
jgi:hypothetical protein